MALALALSGCDSAPDADPAAPSAPLPTPVIAEATDADGPQPTVVPSLAAGAASGAPQDDSAREPAAKPTAATFLGNAAVAPGATPTPSALRPTTAVTFIVSNTLGKGMAIRSTPASREPGKAWPDGTRMSGLGAEQDAYGWTWRWVRDPDGNTGWMPSNYLIQDESAPASGSAESAAPATAAASNGAGTPDGLAAPAPAAPPTQIIIPVVVTATPSSQASAGAGATTSSAAIANPTGGQPLAPTGQGSQPSGVATALNAQLPGPNGLALPPNQAPSLAGLGNVGAAQARPAAASSAASAQGQPLSWVLAYDRAETSEQRYLMNSEGVRRTVNASGTYLTIFFRIQNRQKQTGSLTSSSFYLTDGQGRTYNTGIEPHQILPDGSTTSFAGSTVAPGATVALTMTFDVADGASGLVLHTKGGNDIKVE
jgi:hypothetical protein